MQAMLGNVLDDAAVSVDESPAVVLLDFMKAYDMLNREFILLVLSKIGFDADFVNLIARIHHGITAIFLVNEPSTKHNIVSGIRQECPLASLLFTLAA